MDADPHLYDENQPLCAEMSLLLLTPVKSSVLLKSWTARTAPGEIQSDLYVSANVLHRLLIVVKSYTGTITSHCSWDAGNLINNLGDILNFGLAKEQYAAAHPERAPKVKLLVVGDDVSVGRTQGAIVGRRGLAGTVLGKLHNYFNVTLRIHSESYHF